MTILELFGRNEAGILTARKDLDYIGREELLEALKRVNIVFFSFMHADKKKMPHCCSDFVFFFPFLYSSYAFAAKGHICNRSRRQH